MIMINRLDDLAPSFRMAKDRWPEAANMQAHYNDLVQSYENNGSGVIELCNSFVEMVCKTILKELGEVIPSDGKMTLYVSQTLNKLGLKNSRGASAFDKVLSAHNKLADALTEVRNQEGSVAHGKDAFIDVMSNRHTRIYLLSADTILSLILSSYEGVEPNIIYTREPHVRYNHHNKRIDANTMLSAEVDEDGVLVINVQAGERENEFDLRVPASELLYYLDRQAYIDVLDAVRGVTKKVEDELDAIPVDSESDDTEEMPVVESNENIPKTVIFKERIKPDQHIEYNGLYKDKVNTLYEYIIHTLLEGKVENVTKVLNLTKSLLKGMEDEDLVVVDWNTRESTRSRVRLMTKKLLLFFAIDDLDLDFVEDIVEWFALNISGNE